MLTEPDWLTGGQSSHGGGRGPWPPLTTATAHAIPYLPKRSGQFDFW